MNVTESFFIVQNRKALMIMLTQTRPYLPLDTPNFAVFLQYNHCLKALFALEFQCGKCSLVGKSLLLFFSKCDCDINVRRLHNIV